MLMEIANAFVTLASLILLLMIVVVIAASCLDKY